MTNSKDFFFFNNTQISKKTRMIDPDPSFQYDDPHVRMNGKQVREENMSECSGRRVGRTRRWMDNLRECLGKGSLTE